MRTPEKAPPNKSPDKTSAHHKDESAYQALVNKDDDEAAKSDSKKDQSNQSSSLDISNERNKVVVSKCKRATYQGLMIGSVIFDMPMAFFLVVAASSGARYLLTELGISNASLEIIATLIISILSSLSTFCDVTIANPIETAEKLIAPNSEDKLDTEIKKMSSCKRNTTKALTYFNQTTSNLTYIVSAAANVLPVAYLCSEPAVQWSTGIPIAAFGVAYCNLISWEPVRHHAYEFIRRLLSCSSQESMIINGLRAPAKSLELIIQSVSSALYRGAFFGYTMNQILQYMFQEAADDSKHLNYLYFITTLTIYVTFFSRTLNVHKQLFHDEWDRLSQNALKNRRVSRKGLILDAIMALLRSIPAAALLYRHGSGTVGLKLVISIGTGGLIFFHAMYVRYNKRLYHMALKHRFDDEKLLFSDAQSEGNLSTEMMFDQLCEHLKTEKLKTTVTFINASARICRSFALLGFLIDLNQTLSDHNIINLDVYDLLCLHQLWGNTSLENEFSFFQESVIDNLAYYRTKYHIEKISPTYGWGAFWKPKHQYPTETLKALLPQAAEKSVSQQM